MNTPVAGTADDVITAARLPTAAELRRRASIPAQLWRFTLINLKILRMVRKGH